MTFIVVISDNVLYTGIYVNIYVLDNLDMDYVYDEELFQKITNEIEIPLFDSDNILLRDATPNEIWSEVCVFVNSYKL